MTLCCPELSFRIFGTHTFAFLGTRALFSQHSGITLKNLEKTFRLPKCVCLRHNGLLYFRNISFRYRGLYVYCKHFSILLGIKALFWIFQLFRGDLGLVWKKESKVISVRISELEYQRIQRYCRKRGISVSQFLKEAIRYYLSRRLISQLYSI